MESLECLKILIDEIGIDFIRAKDGIDDSLLHIAAEKGSDKICKFLLDKGVSIEIRDKNGLTPLHRSIRNNPDDIVSIDCVKLFIESGADVKAEDNNKNTALHFLAKWCEDEADAGSLMKLCIDKGANLEAVNNDGCTPLLSACTPFHGNPIMIRTLLELGADIHLHSAKNLRDESGFYWHITNPLLTAAYNSCCTEVLELLIDSGCDINERDGDGNTVMMLVARRGFMDITNSLVPSCSYLLKKGIDIDSQNIKGLTALHISAAGRMGEGNEKLCRLLLENGANTKTTDCDGNTALFKTTSVEIVNMLLVCYHHYASLLFLMKFY